MKFTRFPVLIPDFLQILHFEHVFTSFFRNVYYISLEINTFSGFFVLILICFIIVDQFEISLLCSRSRTEICGTFSISLILKFGFKPKYIVPNSTLSTTNVLIYFKCGQIISFSSDCDFLLAFGYRRSGT